MSRDSEVSQDENAIAQKYALLQHLVAPIIWRHSRVSPKSLLILLWSRFYSAVCIIVKPHTLCTIPFLVSRVVGQGIANILGHWSSRSSKEATFIALCLALKKNDFVLFPCYRCRWHCQAVFPSTTFEVHLCSSLRLG